jgi:hypothetical protein
MTEEFVPRTCEECIKSKYKLPKPQCAYEQGMTHKKTYQYFQNVYGVEIPQHLEAMHILKERKQACLVKVQEQVRRVVTLRRALDTDNILGKIGTLSERIEDIEKDYTLPVIDETNRILSPPKSHDETTVTRVERKPPQKKTPSIDDGLDRDIPERKKKNDMSLSMKDRGWLMYIRNCKKDNIKSYVAKLKKEHPDIADKQIKISTNATGNYMIRYTLNPNIGDE